jgi:hypothetical protein
MSLTFICPPFPGEHFYSVAARTRLITSARSSRSFCTDLLGDPSLRLDFGTGFLRTQEDFVDDGESFANSTLTGFFASFINPPTKREAFLSAIEGGNRTAAAYLLGRVGARRLSQLWYRYCPRPGNESFSMNPRFSVQRPSFFERLAHIT